MTKNQPQFTPEELNLRLECLKIAANSVNYEQIHSIVLLADKFYNWLAENQVPSEGELSATTSLVSDPLN